LYKNSSLIESENLQLLEQIKKAIQLSGNSWVAGKTSLSSISYSEVLAFRMGEIPASREDRRQTAQRNRARQEFLRSLERKRRDRVNFPSPLSPVEVFTTDVNNQGSCSSQGCTFSKRMAVFSPMLFSKIFELFPKFMRKSRHFWIHLKFHQNQSQVSNS